MTEPMNAARLDEIEACVDNARSGPWILRDANAGDGFPRPAWVIATPDREHGDEDVVIHVGDRCVGEFIELARAAVPELLAEVARLKRELADAAPYAEAGKQAALEQAKREYYSGTCDGCSCCTTAQCSEGRCPENSIGDSICPCTCY